MCQAIREWIEDERKAGYEEGIKEGIREGIKKGMKKRNPKACPAIEEWIEEERKAGYEEGIKEGTEEVFKIIIRMNQKGYEIRQIAELVDCTEEKIAEVIAENRKIKK